MREDDGGKEAGMVSANLAELPMPEPKPCPVCGGTEFSAEFDETEDGEIVAFPICDECDENDETRGPLGKPRDKEEEAEEEAIRAWNRFVDKYED